MSCGPRKTTGKTAAITIEVTPNQKKDILAYYTNAAMLAVDVELSKDKNPLPDQFFLTTAGCNTPNAPLIRSMIMLIYSMINTIGLQENLKLNDIVTETAIYRMDASYNAGNFGFSFTSNCDAASVVTIDKICPTNGLLVKTYCVEKDQWGIYHDGGCGTFNQPIKTNAVACGYVPPRPAGELIKLECVDVNQWGVYTDGNYGTYRQLILEKSTDCGYVPPIPGGTLLSSECVGVDNIGVYADGNYGTYREAIQKNSTDCGYVPPEPAGTLITTECVGVNQVGVYADGNYGTYRSTIQDNSESCGYVQPPTAGREIRRTCVDKDLWGIYTDGNNGEIRELIKANSTDCGYIVPAVSGTELGRFCEGTTRYARISDGAGGFTKELIMEKSPECGFAATNPTISLTASHSTIRQGDTETLSASFYGFEPNKRYSVTWNTLCPAEFNGIATAIRTDFLQTDYNGDSTNPMTFIQTDNGSKPRGTYDTWVECASEYAESNHVSRTFIGSSIPPAQPPVGGGYPNPSAPGTGGGDGTPTGGPLSLKLSMVKSSVGWMEYQYLKLELIGGTPATMYSIVTHNAGSSDFVYQNTQADTDINGYWTGSFDMFNNEPYAPSITHYGKILGHNIESNRVTWTNDRDSSPATEPIYNHALLFEVISPGYTYPERITARMSLTGARKNSGYDIEVIDAITNVRVVNPLYCNTDGDGNAYWEEDLYTISSGQRQLKAKLFWHQDYTRTVITQSNTVNVTVT